MTSKNKSYKKAVILGAAGFIGINLSRCLANQGFKLVCFDRFLSPHWPNSATAIAGDFADLPNRLLQELDHSLVFHLISCSLPSPDSSQTLNEVQSDLVATIRILEETKSRDIRWVFMSSGGTVYGQNSEDEIKETSPTNPICSYGITKITIEKYFNFYRALHHIDYVIVRPANPYGPWQNPQRGQGVVSTMVYKALEKDTIVIWGDGENVRDYIFISDAINGILSAASSGRPGEIYNIGTAKGLSINQLVDIISETLNVKLDIKYSEPRYVDVRRNVLSIDKLSTHTEWRPMTHIRSGVAKTAAWLASHQNFYKG